MTSKLSFSRAERLRAAEDFRRAFESGVRFRGDRMNLLYGPLALLEHEGVEIHSRWAVVVGRKYGNAVRRNRAKRLVRDRIRHLKSTFPQGHFFIVEILPRASAWSGAELQSAISHLLDHAGKRLQA